MIPIQESLKLQEKLRNRDEHSCFPDVLEEYYKCIAYTKKGKFRKGIKEIDAWCQANLVMDNKKFLFKDIVLSNYETIVKIKNHLENKTIRFPKKHKERLIGIYSTNLDRIAFVSSLDIIVCPYCNRNFINSTNDRTMCQFDHFLSKDIYPLFAVSYFNLVPVCNSCNHIKHDKSITYSPHNPSISNVNSLLNFSASIVGGNLTDRDSYHINIIPQNNIIEKNIKILSLEEIYQIHTNIPVNLYKKSQIYSKEYVVDLYQKHPDIFSSESEIWELLLDTKIEDNKLGEKPLSKITYDIAKEMTIL